MSSWTQVEGVVIESNILEMLEDKARRMTKEGTPEEDSIEVDD